MNNLRSNTSGIDCSIGQFQKDLYDSLDANYTFDITGFPRVYKNNKEEGVFPETWNETSQDYEDVYLDVSRPMQFMFIDGDTHTTEDGLYFIAPLKVVVIVNLSNIGTVGRDDAEIQREVVSAIKNDVFEEFEITGIEKTIDNVFQGFDTKTIKHSDMQPYHVFAVTGKLGYYLNKKCS